MVFLFEEERQSFTVFSCESTDDFNFLFFIHK